MILPSSDHAETRSIKDQSKLNNDPPPDGIFRIWSHLLFIGNMVDTHDFDRDTPVSVFIAMKSTTMLSDR